MDSRSCLQIIKYEWEQFCTNTTLHGWRFTVLPQRSTTEKLLWLLICVIALAAAIFLLLMSWYKFSENPTILVTDSTKYPVYHYPFPAVTICSLNKISKVKAEELAKNLSTSQKSEFAEANQLVNDLLILGQLINLDNPNIEEKEYLKLQKILDFNQLNIEHLLQQLAPSCDSLLRSCKWKGEAKRCNSLFKQIKTSYGFCCAFNYFALDKNAFKGKLAKKSPKEPRRISACGFQTGLEILLENFPHDYFTTHIPSIGFRVLTHNPFRFPNSAIQDTLIPIKTNHFIAINPEITYASKNVRALSVPQRHCLFSDERKLLNYGSYNFHNCMLECQINLTKEYCGCVPFYDVSREGLAKRTIRVCDLLDLKCLQENEHLVTSSVPGYNFDLLNENHIYGYEKGTCDCLPDCEYVDYLAESSSGVFDRSFSAELDLFSDSAQDVSNQSVVRVFFDDLVGQKNRMDVIFTWNTLLAYYGGILGLLTGFSFISAVEIIYFFTIRLVTDASKIDRENKTTAPQTEYTRSNRQSMNWNLNLNILKQELEIKKKEDWSFS